MATGKIVLITGASQGLGLAITRVAGTRDVSAHYILACRDVGAGEKAIDELKQSGVIASLELLQLDTTDNSAISTAVDRISNTHGRLDVLINNAGIARLPQDDSLDMLRAAYNDMFSVNVTSVACMCHAFWPLLSKSPAPKVINITSGLGSITNCLSKKMQRAAPYGTSKVAVNGLTAHLQVAENDRIALAKDKGTMANVSEVKYYSVAPGFLKTALTRFNERGKDPVEGAEVVVRLLLADDFPGGTQWEMEDGKMQQVPW
ncbi:short chain dehydrogenase/reductase family protein [Melanomma pulvis-pyrius CBS 109.77]|uniref:Short chain dehydrogenase/reductase family protein n=1 Tax=Melanomma pulvis-pyrius CBS 109.77 TaxID=1314802 RepID=A0A6A6X904_9PLEO|nr:short chain dehydrogenase/reductase family protein [Melanomma pulvis-pyrius CBS 109.77]